MPEFEVLREKVSSNPAIKNVLRKSAEEYHNELAKAQSKPVRNKVEQLELNIE